MLNLNFIFGGIFIEMNVKTDEKENIPNFMLKNLVYLSLCYMTIHDGFFFYFYLRSNILYISGL